MRNKTVYNLALCACFTALALALSWVERFIPLGLIVPLPGVKLGLANIITLAALYILGTKQAFAILIVRCVLGSLFGGLSGIVFSLFGGLLALFVMTLMSHCSKLSIFGISIAGAAAHNIGQICAAIVVLGNLYVLAWLPPLLLMSLLTGSVTGTVCANMLKALSHSGIRLKDE